MTQDNTEPNNARHETGAATRRKVLGDAYVERAKENRTDFDAPFQDMIIESAWGHVWSRPNWTLRERSMVTIALLAALGRDGELELHVRSTRNTGATQDDIREAMLHVSIYAGVPAANHAVGIVKRTFEEMDAADGDG